MTDPAPHVSVVLPVYNGTPYLQSALDSILEQTFEDFEVIAIDDGSTDGSLEVLQEAARKDARMRVITRENRGITATLNEGIEAARGALIARMDCDDLATPDRFAKQVAFLQSHPEVVAIGSQIMLMDPESRDLKALPMPLSHAEIDRLHRTTEGGGMCQICHPTAMIRAAALKEVGGYREGYDAAEDLDLWLRLAEVGHLANADEIYLRYRQHPNSIGYAKRNEQRQSAWRAARDAAERRGEPFAQPQPKTSQEATGQDVYSKWGWWALSGGNVDTARTYARKALAQKPFSTKNWKLVYCTLRGQRDG